MDLTPEQMEAIQARALADAEADWKRLTNAGYSPERVKTMVQEMAHERAEQSWAAHASEYEFDVSDNEASDEEPLQEDTKPWWKFW